MENPHVLALPEQGVQDLSCSFAHGARANAVDAPCVRVAKRDGHLIMLGCLHMDTVSHVSAQASS